MTELINLKIPCKKKKNKIKKIPCSLKHLLLYSWKIETVLKLSLLSYVDIFLFEKMLYVVIQAWEDAFAFSTS